MFHWAFLMNLNEFFESLKLTKIFFHLHKLRIFRYGKLYWHKFLNPVLFDKMLVHYPLSLSCSNFVHPTLFYKSKSYSPETGLSYKSKFLSSGCFLLSILLNISYIISFPSLRKKKLKCKFLRRGKVNLSSIFSTWTIFLSQFISIV